MADLKDYETAADAERAHHAAMVHGILAVAEKHKALGNLLNMAGLAILTTPAAAVLIAWVVTR